MMNRMLWLPALLLAVWCVPSAGAAEVEPADVLPVETPAPVDSLQVGGMLKPCREVRLASRSQGVIDSIAEEGKLVKEGEAVVQLEDEMERLQLQQQRLVVDMREAESEAAQLLGGGDGISRLEAKEKELNLKISHNLVEQTREMLDRRRVIAPFDGVVIEKMRSAGEAVDEFVPVLTVVDLGKLHFEAYLPASKLGIVQEGQTARITVANLPDQEFDGVVDMVAPVVNPASSECKIRIVIDNTDRVLSSGLPGVATIDTAGTIEDAEADSDHAALSGHESDHEEP